MLANAGGSRLGWQKGRVVAKAGLARRKENRRSLGFARDDKKERVVVGKGRLLDERAFVKGEGACQRKPDVGRDAVSFGNRPFLWRV
jgi:hypothetical protein